MRILRVTSCGMRWVRRVAHRSYLKEAGQLASQSSRWLNTGVRWIFPMTCLFMVISTRAIPFWAWTRISLRTYSFFWRRLESKSTALKTKILIPGVSVCIQLIGFQMRSHKAVTISSMMINIYLFRLVLKMWQSRCPWTPLRLMVNILVIRMFVPWLYSR